MTVVTILALVALLLTIVSFFRPDFPLLQVAVLLVCVCLLVPTFIR